MVEQGRRYNPIKTDRASVVATEAKIHTWLKQNRPGYNAEKWSDPIENYSIPGEFTISLPPEVDNILTPEEKVGLIEGNLPEGWLPPVNLI